MNTELENKIKADIIKHDAMIISVNLQMNDCYNALIAGELNRVLYHDDKTLKLSNDSMKFISSFIEKYIDNMTNEEKEIFYTYATKGERYV